MRPTTNPLLQLVPQRVRHTKRLVQRVQWSRSEVLAVRGGPLHDPPISLDRARRDSLSEVHPGEHFGRPGGAWQQRWFRVDVSAATAAERGRRHLQWDCEGETTVFHDGTPWAGLDIGHKTCPLPDDACTLWLDCSTWQTGIWPPGVHPQAVQIGRSGLRFDGCRIRIRDEEAWQVRWDLDAAVQLMSALLERDGIPNRDGFGHVASIDACSPLLRFLLRELDRACDAFARGGIAALQAALKELLHTLPAESWQPIAALCGHAHLDMVWLWPEMATRRKAVHTFATTLRLLERYPEFTFVQSQPALYRAVAEDAPTLWAQIEKRIADGRWEVTGGFDVEPDNHLPCGEALARSLVHGQRQIQSLRGKPSDVCWLPDVFGYSAALPQILALGGVRHFFTTKMTWSQVTRFPYNSFVWRGHDGSEVLAHLCPTNYNGSVDLRDLTLAVRDHRQSDVHPEVLLPTGYGDGGGGPSEAMCERARRFRNLAGAPRTRWTGGDAFFRRMRSVRGSLPVYQGELYLEYHRGTYTTQSELKRLYRAAEVALQTQEAARVACGGGPVDAHAWQRVAFAQFHDALPGSSIGLVYEQLEPELETLAKGALDDARKTLARAHRSRSMAVFNPSPVARHAWVEHESDGCVVSVPPLACVRLADATVPPPPVPAASRHLLDNGIVRAAFDAEGQLTALSIDGRPLALAAPAGFALHHDQPASFDAWDIDHYTVRCGERVATPLHLEVVEAGPWRRTLRGTRPIGVASLLVVEYHLDAAARHLRVDIHVEWREANTLLRWEIPTQYRGRWAEFGCPFGAIRRTQWPGGPAEEAQWEVPASRWAAVTNEDGEGLALLTEAKYGFSCREGVLGVSLLRSPKMPDPRADMRSHRIRFAVGRHTTSNDDGYSTAAAADALFAPLIVQPMAPFGPPFTYESLGTLTPSWVLPAEDGDGFVVRFHETGGAAGTARVRFASAPRNVALVDFLGRKRATARRPHGTTAEFDYAPYQVISLRVRPRS